MPVDRLQSQFTVGDIVNIPCVVTAIGGTPQKPTVSLTTKYSGWSTTAPDVIGQTIANIQVIEDK